MDRICTATLPIVETDRQGGAMEFSGSLVGILVLVGTLMLLVNYGPSADMRVVLRDIGIRLAGLVGLLAILALGFGGLVLLFKVVRYAWNISGS